MTLFSHEIDLPLPPDRAITLFTPRGEEAWVPGWAPAYVDPPGGETTEGMIFSTGDGATWWTCLRWDPPGLVRYLRLTPGRKVARVEVRCIAARDGCRAHVSYDWFGLSPEGTAEISAITQQTFAAEIDGWRALILRNPGLAP